MLIVTERGHAYTVVEDEGDEAMVFLRSQDRESIRYAAAVLGQLGHGVPAIVEQPEWDYQFRLHLNRAEWEDFAAHQAEAVSAHKLKPAVSEARGHSHPISEAVFDLFVYLSRNRPDGSVPAWLK